MADKTNNSMYTKNELKKFGITLGIVTLAWGGFSLWKKNDLYIYFFMASPLFFLSSFFLPSLLKPLQLLFNNLIKFAGWITTIIVILLLYYVIITPVGILARLLGKDFLDKKWDPSKRSYWKVRSEKTTDSNQYEKQY